MKLNIASEYLISSVVMMYVNMFCSQVAYVIIGQQDKGLIVGG